MALDNPFDLRRYASIASPPPQQNPLMKAYRNVSFDNPQLRGQTAPPVSEAARQVEDPYISALSRMHSGKATEAYRSHLAELPQSGNYQPSKWRRLGAALTAGAASFGKDPQNALALGEQVRDARYRGALENWQLKGAGLKEQAGLEAVDQTAQLARMKQILDYKNTQADNERLDRTQRANEKYQQDTINARLQAGWQKDYGPNGELILVNPATHETMDTGMQTSKTTDIANDRTRLGYEGTRVGLDKQRVGFEGQRVGLEGQRVGLEGQRVAQGNVGLGLEADRNRIAQQAADTSRASAEATRLGAGNNQISPQQQMDAETLAVRNVIRQHPEWSNWVGEAGIKTPGDYWGSGPSQSDPNYQQFLQEVEKEKQKTLGARPPGAYVPPADGATVSPMRFDFNKLPR